LGAKGFCTYGCPYGALFGLADRVAPGRIVVSDACTHCGQCTAVCSSNVRVHQEVAQFGAVVDPGCMKCMDCVSTCPTGALSFRFTAPLRGWRARRKRPRSDFSWPEELAMLAAFGGALYALRGLYGAVPFLLAIGAAVLAALFTVIGIRLLRQADFAVQRLTLRRAGAWTGAGVGAAALLAAFGAFLGHSALVQHRTARGERLAARAMALAPTAAERAELLAASTASLGSAERWGLFADPRVHQLQGLVARERGELALAERHLRRALELRPDWSAAVIPLTDLLMLRGAQAEASGMLRALLADDPHLEPARRRLELLQRRDPSTATERATGKQ
jgi:ferredoxin